MTWQLADDEIREIFADVDSDESDLSLDHDESTEGESDSEAITPGPEISQPEPVLVESDDVLVPFDNRELKQVAVNIVIRTAHVMASVLRGTNELRSFRQRVVSPTSRVDSPTSLCHILGQFANVFKRSYDIFADNLILVCQI